MYSVILKKNQWIFFVVVVSSFSFFFLSFSLGERGLGGGRGLLSGGIFKYYI